MEQSPELIPRQYPPSTPPPEEIQYSGFGEVVPENEQKVLEELHKKEEVLDERFATDYLSNELGILTPSEKLAETERVKKISDGLHYNAAILKQVGITTSPKIGRNRVGNYLGTYTLKALRKQLDVAAARQNQFAQDEVTKSLTERALFLEKIVLVQLAKCLSGEFLFYLSTHPADICYRYDAVGIDKKTRQVEFVIDVTLGKKRSDSPISREKVQKTQRSNVNGVMVLDGYDGYEQNGMLYTPAPFLMVPLLSVSLPDKTAEGEDNLRNLIDRMSPSFKEPSKRDFENTLYLVRELIHSIDTIKDIYDPAKGRNLFNVPEIQKRAGQLYGGLTPEEQSHWTSIPEEVNIAIREWRWRTDELRHRFCTIGATLAQKAGNNLKVC